MTLYQDALAEGIAILPGFLCAYSEKWKGYIRVNCGFPFDPAIQGALSRLGELTRDQISSRLKKKNPPNG